MLRVERNVSFPSGPLIANRSHPLLRAGGEFFWLADSTAGTPIDLLSGQPGISGVSRSLSLVNDVPMVQVTGNDTFYGAAAPVVCPPNVTIYGVVSGTWSVGDQATGRDAVVGGWIDSDHGSNPWGLNSSAVLCGLREHYYGKSPVTCALTYSDGSAEEHYISVLSSDEYSRSRIWFVALAFTDQVGFTLYAKDLVYGTERVSVQSRAKSLNPTSNYFSTLYFAPYGWPSPWSGRPFLGAGCLSGWTPTALSESELRSVAADMWDVFQAPEWAWTFDAQSELGAQIAGSQSGTGASSGAITTAITGAGVQLGLGASSGGLATAITPAGTQAGEGASAGELATAITPAGTQTGSGASSGALTTAVTLAATVQGVGAANGDILTQVTIAGEQLATALQVLALQSGISVAGIVSGTGAQSGELAGSAAQIQGGQSGEGAQVGNIVLIVTVGGQQLADSLIQGGIATSITVAGQQYGTGASSGQLAGNPALIVGTQAGVGAAGLILSTSITLTGQQIADAILAGSLTTEVRIGAVQSGVGVIVGGINSEIRVAGSVGGQGSQAGSIVDGLLLVLMPSPGFIVRAMPRKFLVRAG